MGCQTKDEDDEDDDYDFGVKNDDDYLSRSLPLITRQKPRRRECLFHKLVYNLDDDDDNDGHFIEADTYLYYNYNYYYQ